MGTGIYTGLVDHSPKAVARRSCTVVRGLLDNVSVRRGRYLLAALKAATRAGSFDPLAAMLRYAQRFTARIDFTSRETAETQLPATNAFRDAREADDLGIRLVMP